METGRRLGAGFEVEREHTYPCRDKEEPLNPAQHLGVFTFGKRRTEMDQCWRCGMYVLSGAVASLKGGAKVVACPRCITAYHEYVVNTKEFIAVRQAEQVEGFRIAALAGGSLIWKTLPSRVLNGIESHEALGNLFNLSVEFFKPNEAARRANLKVDADLAKFIREVTNSEKKE
jgi:hypothetical protein